MRAAALSLVVRPARRSLLHLLQGEQGLTVTEYAVAAGLIAATLVGTMQTLGATIDAVIVSIMAFM